MVAAGNPLKLTSLHDVQRLQARYINRALGTGTRVVFDELLAQQGIQSGEIVGYEHTEPSHTALAHAIASGSADAGLGIAVAAKAQGLDFIPLAQESYHLVCLKSALDQAPVIALRKLLQTPQWVKILVGLEGYTPEQSGQVQSLRTVLPWWDFSKKPSRPRAA
jgi:molybdate-binding protein